MQEGNGPKGGNAIPVAGFGLVMALIIGVRHGLLAALVMVAVTAAGTLIVAKLASSRRK